ncbi:MAG: DNA repair protein RecN [Clostridiales bacterium]|nr:DNA repair protein RecN [Clostridiales bacterium]
MLKTLKIENIAVIESAEIEFAAGLNILTGETGAGKSIVVDAINAILGERTSKELVRSGADYAFVSAYFDNVGEEAQRVLDELGIEKSGCELLITRKIYAAGKTVCKINGFQATAAMLKRVAGSLVNIHGQHDSQALLDPQRHTAYLDMLSKNKAVYDAYKDSFHRLISVRRRLKALALDEDSKDRQLELLNYQIKELEDAQIVPGERQELLKKKALFDSSEQIKLALEEVKAGILGGVDMGGVLGAVTDIKGALSALRVKSGEAESMLSMLEEAGEILHEVARKAEAESDATYFDSNERDNVEARLQELFSLGKKYGESEEEMLAFLSEAVKKRDAILYSDEELEKLNAEYDKCYADALQKAAALSSERQKVAGEFEKAVKAELQFLEMPKISFKVSFSKGNLSSAGIDKVEFLISANPGEAEKPLSKIASGGELSRIMLAFKNILARADTIGTLIFDEIDTGVSGKASGKIGLKLKSVSKETQVIAVTHSAQIAAAADRHLLIEKEFKSGKTYTKVTALTFDERVHELARIMGGLNITESLLQSARELLENSAGM